MKEKRSIDYNVVRRSGIMQRKKLCSQMTAGVLALLLVMSSVLLSAPEAYALPPCNYEHDTFTGEDCYAPGSLEASYVDYLQGRWMCDTQLARRGQLCGKWSRMVLKALGSKTKETNYYGLRFNKKNFLKVCKGVKPGTKLVLGQAKYEDLKSVSHAIVLLKVTSDEVYWADCNWNHDNVIHYRHGTVTDFINFYHYKSSKYSYLHFVIKIKKYRYYSKPQTVTSVAGGSGAARIAWTYTPGAVQYRVYRSTSKNGKMVLAGTTKACAYTDADAKPGKTYYYKVTAVKKDGSKVSGSKVSAKARLDCPHAAIKYAKGKKQGTLSWKPVEGADRYIVYRKSGRSGKWKKVKTLAKTSYTDKYMTRKGKSYWYKVAAASKSNSAITSRFSPWVTPATYAWVP